MAENSAFSPGVWRENEGGRRKTIEIKFLQEGKDTKQKRGKFDKMNKGMTKEGDLPSFFQSKLLSLSATVFII